MRLVAERVTKVWKVLRKEVTPTTQSHLGKSPAGREDQPMRSSMMTRKMGRMAKSVMKNEKEKKEGEARGTADKRIRGVGPVVSAGKISYDQLCVVVFSVESDCQGASGIVPTACMAFFCSLPHFL
jgi:hypothetical protein